MSNGTGAGASLTEQGTTALWVTFAFTVTATVVLTTLAYIRNVKPEARLMYYLLALINGITALAYLTMALGNSTMTAHNNVRQFEWIRYAAWAFVGPITLTLMGLLAGAHWVSIVWVIFLSMVGIAGGFAAAVSSGFNATWPIFALAIAVGFVPVVIALAFTFRASAHKIHREIGKLYDLLAFSLIVLAVGYVIVWGVSEGGFITTVDQEVITFATLDSSAKVGFAFVFVYCRESIARYGSVWGINTGLDIDFPIARSTYTSSGSNYATEPATPVVFGEHRDLAYAQLHAATGTQLTKRA